jgi:serine/threonine protein phosphatase 1
MFRRTNPALRSPRTTGGHRVYAIGDVHGRLDLLEALLAEIKRHNTLTAAEETTTTLVFLGDLIDRGPQSAQCLDLIASLHDIGGTIVTRGNHEDMMIAAAKGDAAAQRAWMANGGLQTLGSFGIAPPLSHEDAVDFGDRLARRVPERAWRFLSETKPSWTCGDYHFVHAGVRPGTPLSRQDETDLFSIREEFTSSDQWHGAVIVHGHSIVDRIEIRHNRIACDTGAYFSGRLSCICLDGDLRTVLST